ncbi:sensor domain-containing protein [Actinoallomurus sp. NPDC052308]|uniref:sensor histidine kinase n=1 Tax=Actinoallomurus sp. NPDC052308 TaxID=3155530 RepID=UPI00343BDD3B
MISIDGSRSASWWSVTAKSLRSTTRYLFVGFGTGVLALFALIGLLVVGALSLIGIGLPALPAAVAGVRRLAGTERRRASAFLDAPVPDQYRSLDGGFTARLRSVLGDPATGRDLAWLAIHGLTGTVGGYLALGLPLAALNAATMPLWWWAVPGSAPSVIGLPVDSWPAALTTPFVAVGYAALGLVVLPRLARLDARMSRALLRPTDRVRLSERVTELTATRAAALEAHAAELRRLERDLHDGTQNRLVAVVMHLGILDRALESAPESQRALAARAQQAADDALTHMRRVVRTIYPPILDERGLDGAVAALAAHCPIPCLLESAEVPRAPAAVEAAAYFSIAEALTNVAKHSGARQAVVRLTGRDGTLVIEVTDDGRGGADERVGSGLAGIRRRVAALDGRTELISPPGGPTALRVELPCGS